MNKNILTLKVASRRAIHSRDGPTPRQAALNLTLSILYGPHALARLVRVQKEMDYTNKGD